MARKRRSLEPVAVPSKDPKDAPRYKDQFQQTVGAKVEDAGKKLEGQGRNILYGIGALVVLGIIVVSIMHYMGVPVPSGDDLMRGVERLAHVLS